jgi:hypothetical protein
MPGKGFTSETKLVAGPGLPIPQMPGKGFTSDVSLIS